MFKPDQPASIRTAPLVRHPAPRVVQRLARRMRLRGGILKDCTLNPDYVEACVAALPDVHAVRFNPRGASLVVHHTAHAHIASQVLHTLTHLPAEAFAPGPARQPRISGRRLGLHVLTAAAIPLSPLPVQIGLALLVGLPVIIDGVKNLFTHGLTAKSLDAASTGLCLALGKTAAVGTISCMRLLGDYLKQENDTRSGELLTSLLRLDKTTVWIERRGTEVEVPVEDVRVGDIASCGPGDLVAVDGEVVSGNALVNNSMITGESVPVHVAQGDEVTSGAVVESGHLRIRAKRTGADTAMSGIHTFLKRSLADRSLPELRGDVLADRLVPVTLGLGAFTYSMTGDAARAASMTSIDFVCSVKFPARFSVKSSTVAAGRHDVLFKGGSALDAMAGVDVVVFDKTGTLTANELQVTDIVSTGNWTSKQILTLAARLEQHYDHPVARTILKEAARSRLDVPAVGNVDFHVSHGICAMVDGKKSQVGSERFISRLEGGDGNAIKTAEATAERLRKQGKMVLYVAQSGTVQGLIAMQDRIRPETKEALAGLRKLGVKKIVVLTGDHRTTAQRFAARLKGRDGPDVSQLPPVIDAIHWELTPEKKAEVVRDLKATGHRVAVVGDGVNDAPALMNADLGICMPQGGDLARISAQALLLGNDLRSLCAARRIAMRQQAILDTCHREGVLFNSALLALAAWGKLSPFTAAAAHNLNTFALLAYAVRAARSPLPCRPDLQPQEQTPDKPVSTALDGSVQAC